MKRQPSEWEKKYFATNMIDKGLISKYRNSSCRSKKKKAHTHTQNNQKMGRRSK